MEFVKIPMERVKVLVGADGEVKKKIEEFGNVKLKIGKEGDVEIIGEPINEWRVKDIVMGIGRGFNPEKVFKLFNDEYYLKLIDLRELFTSTKEIKRVKGRVIGREGKARRIIEETTGVDICVYGNTIGIIGMLDEVNLAENGIMKLLNGASHSKVYKFLEKERRKIKEERALLWKKE